MTDLASSFTWLQPRSMLDPLQIHPCALRTLERWNARSRLATQPFLLGRLIVSLTSYPPRFPTLHLTLKSLLTQTLAPDAVMLWIAEADLHALPKSVTALTSCGLTVRTCEDLRSYKKIVPALAEFPDAFITTADDDIYYEEDWLARLAAVHVPGRHDVICHRAHEIRHGTRGRPLPYVMWKLDSAAADSAHLFLTGCGGVLYPPRSLHQDTVDRARFAALCPTNDDIWFYWMARRAGSSIRKVAGRRTVRTWPGTQSRALFHVNVLNGANDRQIRAMTRAYGYPPAL